VSSMCLGLSSAPGGLWPAMTVRGDREAIAVQDDGEPEEVVAVPVRHVDRGQVPAAGLDPPGQGGCLGRGQEGIDEHGILTAHDQGRAHRSPRAGAQPRRQVIAREYQLGCHEHIPAQLTHPGVLL